MNLINPSFLKKKKIDQIPKGKFKSNKNQIQEYLPVPVRPEKVPPQIKKLILEMEKQYIQRYNILIKNRQIYKDIIDNLSTQLDGRAITSENITDFLSKIRGNQHNQDNTQAE